MELNCFWGSGKAKHREPGRERYAGAWVSLAGLPADLEVTVRKWIGCVVLLAVTTGWGQQGQQGQQARAARATTEKMAATVMREWPAGVVATIKKPGEWSYEEGVLLDGLAAEWAVTHEAAQFAYIQASVDKYVKADGTILMGPAGAMGPSGRMFPVDAHTLDDIEMGRAVLFVYRQTRDARYAKAAKILHEALKVQPRNASGGYWHKQIYPNQMWLDGAYMAEPFRAEYAATFGAQEGEWDDIAKQFVLMQAHMRDPKTGLLRHGWDPSKQMPWADRQTGLSPEVWARAMGWYCMALVDTLDWMPKDNARRLQLLGVLRETLAAVAKYQDADGLWWQVMDQGSGQARAKNGSGLVVRAGKATAPAAGNFEETSASAMFVYALAKAAAKGYASGRYAENARRGWEAIQARFVTERDGDVVLTGTVKAAGLGGTPYRSGTYAYYVGEARGDQDAKGVGAYLLAGSELGR